MINQIEKLKDFGIYKDFSWSNSSGIKDFSKKNIFYGWNYSGKTTLSRVFSSLRDKKIHNGFEDAYFKIKTTQGDFDSNCLDQFPFDVLVFNSDYIIENLTFSFHKDEISDSKTILFEVGENAIYETKIQQLKTEIDKINGNETLIGSKAKFRTIIEEFEIYDKSNNGKFTLFAREIKDDHFISLINFTKTNLKSIIAKLDPDLKKHIITDKKRLFQLSEIVKTNSAKQEIDRVSFRTDYPQLILKVNEVLQCIPERIELHNILNKQSEVYDWLKKGKELNKPNEKCLFCDNTIDEKRYLELSEFFNSQASQLRLKIDKLKESINDELLNISTLKLPQSNNDFNLGYIEGYTQLKKRLDKSIEIYKKNLKQLISKLDYKLFKSLHLPVPEYKAFPIQTIHDIIDEIDNHIEKNNDFTSGFEYKIESERNIYLNHLVANFLMRENYFRKEKRYQKALVELAKLDSKIKSYNEAITFFEAKKVSDTEGALRYTAFIQSFLNRTDIEIKVDSLTKKFRLLRNNENASNLSDGEKTAIALSHFLVTINSYESKGTFKDIIVFVDDPISSLDGNHIFQINSIFKELFFSNNNPGGEWKLKCHQLFLSTHNFDFFKLLNELPKENFSKEAKYYIERNFDENNTSIKPLPAILDKYKSEYHFLFKEIYEFSKLKKPLKSEKLLLLPNTLRRFLEMYTLTKYPSFDPVDKRADIIFGKEISKRICKPFHYFSHLDNLDRIGKQSEFVVDIPVACKALISQIKKKDKVHFEALEKAVNL